MLMFKNNTRIKNFSLVVFILVSFVIILKIDFNFECIFKRVFDFPCPGCGTTRALNSIKEVKLLESFNYNILTVQIFIFILVSIIILIYDVIFNKEKYFELIRVILKKYYIIIIFLIFLSFIVNLVRGI